MSEPVNQEPDRLISFLYALIIAGLSGERKRNCSRMEKNIVGLHYILDNKGKKECKASAYRL